ncbi:MAG: hypothetical protein RJQ10_11475 [Haliea sp.]
MATMLYFHILTGVLGIVSGFAVFLGQATLFPLALQQSGHVCS